MGKRAILTLMEGSFEQGFPAILQISKDDASAKTGIQVSGKLPSAPDIPEAFQNWQLAYRQMLMLHFRIKPKPAQITNFSYHQLGDDLVVSLNNWLNSGSREWQKIRDGLQRSLSDTDEIQFIIQTNDIRLRQLPWHLWDFFEHYRKAEVALSTPEYEIQKRSLINKPSDKLRILAIFGNSQGIDIEKDRTFLERLSNKAKTEFLIEPQPEQLNERLWEHGWDILFFAGHSSSEEKGLIQLNETDTITLAQLRYALKKAIERGLRLAIFNSCDGLGLAQQLADLRIPQVIVMREPVPDMVAQEFLRHFLAAFSSGQTLYASVREARERLLILERKFPFATWLPVICQNPAEAPMTWPQKGRYTRRNRRTTLRQSVYPILSKWRSLRTVLLISVAVTTIIMGVRYLGMLQTWELQAYDQLIRQRPDEGPDSRLLVVAIKNEDFQLPEQQHRRPGTSLSDLALARLLEKLEAYQPRAIGLDIFHDFPVDSQQTDLKTRLQQSNRLFAVCNVGESGGEGSILPPPDLPQERQGFSNVLPDADGIVRRHLLSMNVPAKSLCTSSKAFSFQVAMRYLKDEGITDKVNQGNWQLGKVVFKHLQPHTGGYQQADTWGNQVLLNYRSYRSPFQIADTVTLTDILRDKIHMDVVKNRIVLIGVINPTSSDNFLTPYSASQPKHPKMAGVIIHAQMVSQILSAVLNGRVLLSVWPQWAEIVWVWSWSFVGGLLAWHFRSLLVLGLAGAASLGVLYGLCFSLIAQGIWVPLVPSALALVVTGSGVIAYLIQKSLFQVKPLSRDVSNLSSNSQKS